MFLQKKNIQNILFFKKFQNIPFFKKFQNIPFFKKFQNIPFFLRNFKTFPFFFLKKKKAFIYKMSTNNFSVEYLATSLYAKLDRRNIFPPLLNNPESYLSPEGTRLKRPPNPFLICRKNVQEEAKRKGTFNMRIISKTTSIFWNNATLSERKIYKKLCNHVFEIYNDRRTTFYKFTPPKVILTPPQDFVVTPMTYPSISFPSASSPLPLPSPPICPSNAFDFTNNINNQLNINTGFDNNQIIVFNYDQTYPLLPYTFNYLYQY
jgi:hypothetical protein